MDHKLCNLCKKPVLRDGFKVKKDGTRCKNCLECNKKNYDAIKKRYISNF